MESCPHDNQLSTIIEQIGPYGRGSDTADGEGFWTSLQRNGRRFESRSSKGPLVRTSRVWVGSKGKSQFNVFSGVMLRISGENTEAKHPISSPQPKPRNKFRKLGEMSYAPQTPTARSTTPRFSGIPTPSGVRSTSGIPTPGRPRSSAANNPPIDYNSDSMRALTDAIRANNPAQHRPAGTGELLAPFNDASVSGRRSVASSRSSVSQSGPRASTSSTMSSSTSTTLSSFDRSTTRPRTPASAVSTSFRSVQTPRTSVSSRPVSRQSDVFRASSRQASYPRALDVGDPVRIESLGVEGTIQFLGETDFKEGLWAGVELSAPFAGRGKNDGSVGGYAPDCFVLNIL